MTIYYRDGNEEQPGDRDPCGRICKYCGKKCDCAAGHLDMFTVLPAFDGEKCISCCKDCLRKEYDPPINP